MDRRIRIRRQLCHVTILQDYHIGKPLRNSGAPLTIRPIRLDDVAVPPLLADLDVVSATNRDAASVIDQLTRALQQH